MLGKLAEGPYLLGNTLRYLDNDGIIRDFPVDKNRSFQVFVPNESRDEFEVFWKKEVESQSDIFPAPEHLLVISDIEGNFNGLTSFLTAHGAIDNQFNWSFGKGHLLINGDLVDRGSYPMAILWLLYKLEDQALAAGGRVHINLGNHDLMNIQGWYNFAHERYQNVVEKVTGRSGYEEAFRFLYGRTNEMGRWLRSKNAIIKMGTHLFVHGGLSDQILPLDLDIGEINAIVRSNTDIDFYNGFSDDPVVNLVMGKLGPIWYRNLVREYDGRPKDTQEQLEKVLNHYQVERMIIGHTVVDDISTDYHGKLIRIDVKHGQDKNTGMTRGILIEGSNIWKVNDLGHSTPLI